MSDQSQSFSSQNESCFTLLNTLDSVQQDYPQKQKGDMGLYDEPFQRSVKQIEEYNNKILNEIEKKNDIYLKNPKLNAQIWKKGPKQRYQKNIIGYIVTKAFKGIITKYKQKSLIICQNYSIKLQDARKFCRQKIRHLNGVSSLKKIFIPQIINFSSKVHYEQEIKTKLATLQYLQWFVMNRYLRQLINSGRMTNKKAYIKIKNEFFPKEILQIRQTLENSLQQLSFL